MNLAIDIGNSFFHMAVFKGNKAEYLYSGNAGDKKIFNLGLKLISKKFLIQKIGFSSVVPKFNNFACKSIIKYFSKIPLNINSKSKLPIKIKVKNPETLGSDRICNAAFGFLVNSPKTNVLIIDLGTANKYDLVLRNGEYIGGIIASGIMISSKALNLNTGKLPLLKFQELCPNSPLIGKNTLEAIQSGLVNYMLYATDGIVRAIKKKYPGKLNIYLSGGSAGLIKSNISFKFKFIENSVLAGINYILNYQ